MSVRSWLQKSAEIWDKTPSLQTLAAQIWENDLDRSVDWMAVALAQLRSNECSEHQTKTTEFASAARALLQEKYLLAGVGGAAAALGTALLGAPVWGGIAAGIVGFYAVEVQYVFVVPCALEGHREPWRASQELLEKSGGTLRGLLNVLPIATHMLTGGFRGQGFLRSWCVGCLAVLCWYEEARVVSSTEHSRRRATRWDLAATEALQVREEKVESAKIKAPIRVLYASDLHQGGLVGARVALQLLSVVEQHRPDVVVLGGDLVDSPMGFLPLKKLVSELSKQVTVLATDGNHDRSWGLERVRQCVLEGGGQWLKDHPWHHDSAGVSVLGEVDQASNDVRSFQVYAAHDPSEFEQAWGTSIDLVFAGHLHGGQVVVAEHDGRLYPAAFLWRWCGLRFFERGVHCLVSRGVSDTLPVRYACPREVVLCEIAP